MPEITFYKPEEFATFVAGQPSLGDMPKCVFLSEKETNRYGYNGYKKNQLVDVDFKFCALVPTPELRQFFTATLSLRDFLPNEWHIMNRAGVLHFECTVKKELVEFLQDIEVAGNQIKKINKVSVSTLKEVVDTSPTVTEKDETFEEVTYRLKQRGDTINLTSKKYGKIVLTIAKGSRHNANLTYICEADWSTARAALHRTVEKELKKKKLTLMRGNVDHRC